jgi:hypothetical protein
MRRRWHTSISVQQQTARAATASNLASPGLQPGPNRANRSGARLALVTIRRSECPRSNGLFDVQAVLTKDCVVC